MSRARSSSVAGHVKPGFEAVREAFIENFTRRNELGAACCIYYRGEKVVDLWGGVHPGTHRLDTHGDASVAGTHGLDTRG